MSANESLSFPLSLKRSHNRFVLAPMTNTQSLESGELSEDEAAWLERRAQGGFGIVMTWAARVSAFGQGWPGQLAVDRDEFLPGLTRLAERLSAAGALSIVQIHHGGFRSPTDLIGGVPYSTFSSEPTKSVPYGARQMSEHDIEAVTQDFIEAAVRVKKAGFDGVELHGAHGYLLAQFLDPSVNQLTNRWGGSFQNRTRIFRDVITGIRAACGQSFMIGVRFSPEDNQPDSNGAHLAETLDFMNLMHQCSVDFLHVSLWDWRKSPVSKVHGDGTLLDILCCYKSPTCPLIAAGKIAENADVDAVINAGADMVAIGKMAIANPDWPRRFGDSSFHLKYPPYSESYVKEQSVGESFVTYLRRWEGFFE